MTQRLLHSSGVRLYLPARQPSAGCVAAAAGAVSARMHVSPDERHEE